MNLKEGRLATIRTPGPGQQVTSQKSRACSQLLESVLLAKAAFSARGGKLNEAEVILLPLANKPNPRTGTLDLLAKVYAQQGKTEEARALWLRALQEEPSNGHFLRALLQLCKP